jgi:hypothetical protein
MSMTDIAKATAFAKECLRWELSSSNMTIVLRHPSGGTRMLLADKISSRTMDYGNMEDIQQVLTEFLANRFFIQINRGTSSLFKWSVIVGLQNRLAGPKGIFDHGHGESDDMLDAIFDACVAAVRLYPATGIRMEAHHPGSRSE